MMRIPMVKPRLPGRFGATLLGEVWLGVLVSSFSLAGPRVFWVSDPVRPNETVMVQGSGFNGGVIVEVGRLRDDAPTAPSASIDVDAWNRAEILQASECCLKFVLPKDEKMGVFACRVTANGATSDAVLVNAPDPWWVQGDSGKTATPGGWLRVCGKCLEFGRPSRVLLKPETGRPMIIDATGDDGYSLRANLPADFSAGVYGVYVHNGHGGNAAWRAAGTVTLDSPAPWPTERFSVLDAYGDEAVAQARKTLEKYRPVPDRTEGIRAALQRATDNGGGIVYFPAGRYGVTNALAVPPRTILRGEGEGLVVLWWGRGRFNLDGGTDLGYERKDDEPKPPPNLVFGRDFAIEDMSLYVPPDYQTVIDGYENVHLRRVRVRVDHYWTLHTRRYEGWIARLGDNGSVTECDFQAKGGGISARRFCTIACNLITAGKTPCPLGGSRQVMVEDNTFVSTHPTAYQNIAGHGKNLYYARNRHEALNTHQADFSFTFDAGTAAYLGTVARVNGGTNLVLSTDPVFEPWAKEISTYWKEAVVCVLEGKGAGQYRDVTANRGREWVIDRPFDVTPDGTSLVTIVPFNGHVLVVGNRFEDANWVNAGYGTSIDVLYASNTLCRCAQLLNYGLDTHGHIQPSWFVQYLDNRLCEGATSIDISGSVRQKPPVYDGPVTRCVVARRNTLATDNSGNIRVSGNVCDVVVEDCVLPRPESVIRADGKARGVVCRNNRFGNGVPRYEGDGIAAAVVVNAPTPMQPPPTH